MALGMKMEPELPSRPESFVPRQTIGLVELEILLPRSGGVLVLTWLA
jgi:hypothetical protein